ncbi:MAG: hypothetical protein MJY41_04655 [Bacteroidales bacterium]|nr:hypothetical protein [Bacteroidales bacterium]
MKRLACLILLAVCIPVHSQNRYISEDWDFVQYLLGNDLERDAAVYVRCGDFFPSDTLDYLRGWTSYAIKDLDNAARNFSGVPANSAFYDKSVFFGAVSYAHSGEYHSAEALLDNWAASLPAADPLLKDSYYLEKSGLALLKGCPDDYLRSSALYGGSSLLGENFELLGQVYSDSYCKPGKKAWKAALASAIIPGAGQWYASDKVSGALTFLLEGAMAAIIVEQWRHYGPQDWRTMVWTGLGAGLHIANICGAAVSVSVRNEKISADRSTAVLYNIHIPLRSVFR